MKGVLKHYNHTTKIATVEVKCDNPQGKQIVVIMKDGELITGEQRKKIYAILGEIADYIGDDLESTKEQLKILFLKDSLESLQSFSFASISKQEASSFIEFLIKLCLEHQIPTSEPLQKSTDDITKMEYACIINKRCVVCQGAAELHHIDAIGAGNDRRTINHIGRRCLSLCRKHHSELHNIGNVKFLQKYHLDGTIKINKQIATVYKLHIEKG